MTRIGVLALQGDFREHELVLQELGIETTQVRLPEHLHSLDGLILPGGESTTLRKLAATFGLVEPLRHMAAAGLPMWGTCAGMILLARDVEGEPPMIGALNARVKRNAFGRQVDSFETSLEVKALTQPDRPFPAVFIRAPWIEEVGPEVNVLAELDSQESGVRRIVAVQQEHLLATAFHPELGGDPRFHQYFLALAG